MIHYLVRFNLFGFKDHSTYCLDGNTRRPVRLNLAARLISRGTVFFSHNKTTSAGLLAEKPSAE
jgi:hypothetical protein